MSTNFFVRLSLTFSICIKNLFLKFQALALSPNSDIDERKALSGCLFAGNGKEEREELVVRRRAHHSAEDTRGPDEACWRRQELPVEVFEDGTAVVCPVSSSTSFHHHNDCGPTQTNLPEQDVLLDMDSLVRIRSRLSA